MSETYHSASDQSLPAASRWGSETSKRKLSRTVLYCALGATIFFMGYAALRVQKEKDAMKKGQDRLVALRGLVQPSRKRLAPEFTDQDGGMLADTPSDAAKLIDPDTLVVAHYEGDEEDVPPVDWKSFEAHLASATGRKVSRQEYSNSAQEIEAVKAGQIHIVAVHAADTPYLVNNAGFVPFAVLGTRSGASGNHLTIAVRSGSRLKSPADLRGHKITCTRPDSITGYRAAIVILAHEAGMRPDVDYDIHFSHGQSRSIRGLVAGEFDVAALSSDKLQAMTKEGSLKPGEYRAMYESQIIPRLAIGCVHNLQPDLAAVVRSAAMSFDNPGGSTDDSSGEPSRFVSMDYKKDFEFVRQMDDNFDPRFGKAAHTGKTP